MTAARRHSWNQLFVLLTVLPSCGSLHVSIPEKKYEITSGGDITLTCTFVPARPDETMFVITWEASPDKDGDPLKVVATSFPNNPPDIAPPYEGRAVLNVNANQRSSTLTLTKVTIQDSRNYQCSVLIPNDDEGTTAATTSLLVLVPPSPPICGIQGTAEYFQDITLTCESEEGSPLPTYNWKTFSVKSIPRPLPPKTILKDGALSLFNISQDTSGFFICTSTNRIGSESCNVTLAVMPPSMNSGATAGIIAGVAAGLVLLVILIYCCCRKKGDKDPRPERSPEDVEFRDKDVPEAGEQYSDKKSNRSPKPSHQLTDNNVVPENNRSVGQKFDDDQQSYTSDKEKRDGKGSEIWSQRYRDDPHDHDRGSQDRVGNDRDRHGGSQDHLDDRRDRHGGSRDHLDDRRDRHGGSRDHLDDRRDRYGGSQDHLDDRRDRHGGSRDHLDDGRNHHGGSRDRLGDRYRGSRDDVSDRGGRNAGSRDQLEYIDGPQRNRYE